MDVFTKKKRSEIMSKIRSKNTGPEILVFKALRQNNIYFQKHYNRVPGSPDIAVPRKKIAIFIDGDFWHGKNFSKTKDRLPKKYWIPKIEGNIKRDRKNRAELRRLGWKVLRIWGSQVNRKFEKTVEQILFFIQKGEKINK
jgi:DNA mismatch endonuclease (patch repair protein)